MNKKSAMSAMGYAIVSVIILGLIMIISAPMLVTNVKEEEKTSEPVTEYNKEPEQNDYSELRMLEERLTSRIDDLERSQANNQGQNTVTDKYICSIEGKLNENGDVVPLDGSDSGEKIVFVCEYRR